MGKASRLRSLRRFRDRVSAERQGLFEGAKVVEVFLPNLNDSTSYTEVVRLDQAERLHADGVLHFHDGHYFCDDARLIAEGIERHTDVMVCDFCSAPSPVCAYGSTEDIDPINHSLHSDGLETHGSVGQWAACEDCAAIIDAGDKWALAARTLDSFAATYPLFPRDALAHGVRQTHTVFWSRPRPRDG